MSPHAEVPSASAGSTAAQGEAARPFAETGFTASLRRLLDASPGVLAAVFVDDEGECIDACARMDAHEAMVIGAQLQAILPTLRGARAHLDGEPHGLRVFGDARDLVLLRVDASCSLVVATKAGEADRLERALADTTLALRREGGMPPPRWDPRGDELVVDVRRSVPSWDYAPRAFTRGGATVAVTDVLGRWTEPGDGDAEALVCYRVRAADGEELTLAHRPSDGGWERRG